MGSCTQSENVSREENIAKNLSLYWHLHEGTYLYIWYLLQYVYHFINVKLKDFVVSWLLGLKPDYEFWTQLVARSFMFIDHETTWKFAVFDFFFALSCYS